MQASLGCGNPTALAQLNPGETVLDLGSGGGIDVLLSARRVGPTGKAYGLDMTDEMLALARENQKKAGVANVEFLKGEIENIPLPDNSVDVIISNCVINLSADKDRVLREAFRVLKPGGRFAVSDVVVTGEIPAAIRKNVELWIGCVAGALRDTDYTAKLASAGFENIAIEPTRIYAVEDARQFLAGQGIDVDAIAAQVDGKFMSAFIRASKRSSNKPVEPIGTGVSRLFLIRWASTAPATATTPATLDSKPERVIVGWAERSEANRPREIALPCWASSCALSSYGNSAPRGRLRPR